MPLPHTQNAPVALWWRYQMSSGNNNHHPFFGVFCRHNIKTWIKFWSICILAICCSKQQETVSMPNKKNIFIVSNNKTGPLFLEFIRLKTSFSFLKRFQGTWLSPFKFPPFLHGLQSHGKKTNLQCLFWFK